MFEANSGRLGYAGPGSNRWNAPAVAGKSVEVQRSQVDDLFKNMIDHDNLAEYDPGKRAFLMSCLLLMRQQGPSVGTKLYPHQKKALTFMLEREREISGPEGRVSSLWQYQDRAGTWQHMITLKNVQTEPVEAKGSLLADDVSRSYVVHVFYILTLCRRWDSEKQLHACH